MLKRVLVVLFLSIMATTAAAQPTAHEPPEVDLALVLAVDRSHSVSADTWALQSFGYASALRSPEVLNAISGGYHGAIAVAVVQWAGYADKVIDWHVITDVRSADALAKKIEALPYRTGSYTGVANAIAFSAVVLRTAPFRTQRWIIDISGDGTENAGGFVTIARLAAVSNGIVINGLPIVAKEPGVPEFYEHQVIGGPGAFSITVNDMKSFPAAIRRKLVREIASQ